MPNSVPDLRVKMPQSIWVSQKMRKSVLVTTESTHHSASSGLAAERCERMITGRDVRYFTALNTWLGVPVCLAC